MLGGPILAIGILWLGWSGHYESVPWWVPGLSTIFIGLADHAHIRLFHRGLHFPSYLHLYLWTDDGDTELPD
jgi:hypothetical protein